MEVVTPAEIQGRAKRDVETEDGLNRVTNYFGGAEPNNEEPSAFLVEFRPVPGGAIRPHFHKVAQFQVVIGGGGAIGKVPVPPISFQYADPSTPYGPIRPSDEQRGIDFLTLRPVARQGLWWMPGNQHELSGTLRRNRAATLDPDASLPIAGSQREDLIDGDEDGLAGYVLRVAAGAEEVVAVPEGSAGQYHLVTRGTVVYEGRELERMALVFVATGERATVKGGTEGAELLVMQFPGRIEPEGESDV
jgi:hypothetical protein